MPQAPQRSVFITSYRSQPASPQVLSAFAEHGHRPHRHGQSTTTGPRAWPVAGANPSQALQWLISSVRPYFQGRPASPCAARCSRWGRRCSSGWAYVRACPRPTPSPCSPARTARSAREPRCRLAKALSGPSHQRLPRPEHTGAVLEGSGDGVPRVLGKRAHGDAPPRSRGPMRRTWASVLPLGHGAGGMQLPHGRPCLPDEDGLFFGRSEPHETNPTAIKA